jgi:Na+-translocating ferredoxin:NAD+ oxidoreductase subunit E
MKPTTASQDFVRGIWRENPVFVQVLGMCPTMAVTTSVVNGFSIGVSTAFVIAMSSITVAAFRRVVPNEVRISTYILIIAMYVTVVDLVLAAGVPSVHKALGAFIPLIVANCIPLARQEVFSCKNSIGRSALDGLGTGLGFTVAQVLMSAVRELLGRGTLVGYHVLGHSFEPWRFFVLPPGGFMTLGFYLLALSWWAGRKKPRKERQWPHPVTQKVAV